jgi:hypothetical protein
VQGSSVRVVPRTPLEQCIFHTSTHPGLGLLSPVVKPTFSSTRKSVKTWPNGCRMSSMGQSICQMMSRSRALCRVEGSVGE